MRLAGTPDVLAGVGTGVPPPASTSSTGALTWIANYPYDAYHIYRSADGVKCATTVLVTPHAKQHSGAFRARSVGSSSVLPDRPFVSDLIHTASIARKQHANEAMPHATSRLGA